MSADNFLFLTKVKSKKPWRLSEVVGDQGQESWHDHTEDLLDALVMAKDIMEVEDIEYGLRLGKLV